MQHEVLIQRTGSEKTRRFMLELISALRRNGAVVRVGYHYGGVGKNLYLYGVGAEERRAARARQLAQHRHCVSFDLGYFSRETHMRFSIDTDHPQQYMDLTPSTPGRFQMLGIELAERFNPNGPILLVGMGRKTHRIPGMTGWEEAKLASLRHRFPDRKILYRPKPASGLNRVVLDLGLDIVPDSIPIQQALQGLSLVACRHSNVAVDAVVAGVPYEADDGAACWLTGRPFTVANRLDFLHRLAYWQWHAGELSECLTFIDSIIKQIPRP